MEEFSVYYASINIRTGKIVSQESEQFGGLEEDWKTQFAKDVAIAKHGVWDLDLDPDGELVAENHSEEMLTCFSTQSAGEALALVVEEYTICQQIGVGAYTKRVRAMPKFADNTPFVSWREEYDDPVSDPIEPTFIANPWKTGAA